MKGIPALALLAAVGLVAAGCASARKIVSGSVSITGTTTLSQVKTGTRITCKGSGPGGGPTATVTKTPEHVIGASEEIVKSGNVPSSKRNLQLTRLRNGKVRVICTR
jgi:hypothetical protein